MHLCQTGSICRLATTVEPLLLWFPALPSEGQMDKPGQSTPSHLSLVHAA